MSNSKTGVIAMPARRLVLATALLGLAAALAPGAVQADSGTLNGTVGPGFSIDLKAPDGSTLKGGRLAPGTYTLTVNDQSDLHNFDLLGPDGKSIEATSIEGTGTSTWSVDLTQTGTYTFHCDAHPTQMVGTFAVGNAPVTPTPAVTVSGLRISTTGHRAHRMVVVKVSVKPAATLVAALKKGKRSLEILSLPLLSGTNTKRIPVPAATKAGSYTLKMVFRPAHGAVAAMTRTVKIPR
jgi:hypothetical protein